MDQNYYISSDQMKPLWFRWEKLVHLTWASSIVGMKSIARVTDGTGICCAVTVSVNTSTSVAVGHANWKRSMYYDKKLVYQQIFLAQQQNSYYINKYLSPTTNQSPNNVLHSNSIVCQCSGINPNINLKMKIILTFSCFYLKSQWRWEKVQIIFILRCLVVTCFVLA